MAESKVQDPPRGGLLLATLAAYVVATAIAFGRVYFGMPTTLRLVGAGLGALLLARLCERLHVLLATFISAVGLLFALGLLVYPETTIAGLPTMATLRALGSAAGDVGQIASQEIAPVVEIPALLVAGIVAVWTAAFSAHALAARAGSGLLAVAPGAALVAFADVVMVDGARFGYMALFLAATLGVLFALGVRRTRQWGPVVPWTPLGRAPRRRILSSTSLRVARRVGALAVVAAVILPWALPGWRSPALVALGGPGLRRTVSIDPIVDIRPALNREAQIELFTVAAARGAYWRMLALDDFDGRRWNSRDLFAEAGLVLPGGGELEPSSAGELDDVRNLHVDVEFTGAFDTQWLPLPFDPLELHTDQTLVRYDSERGVIVAPDGTDEGTRYSAIARLVTPDPELIDTSFDDDPLAGPGTIYTSLPDTVPQEIYDLARSYSRGQPNQYRAALAIQNRLRRLAYDEKAPAGHGTDDILFFLTESKRGYCEQFAGTMAVLLRAIGIPARVAVGFTAGVFDPEDDRWHVSTRNAHAWVEIHFGEYGWLPFEPTPGRRDPSAARFQNPTSLPDSRVPDVPPATEGGGGSSGNPGSPLGGRDEENRQGGGGVLPGGVPAAAPGGFPIALVVLSGLALIVVGLLAIPVTKAVLRTRDLHRSRDARHRVLAEYELFSRRAADVGLGRRPAETLWEYRARLRERVQFSDGHLERLTRLTGRAAYGDGDLGDDEAARARELALAAAHDVLASVPPSRRLLGAFRPGR